jgi:hypothetical protein
VPEIRPSLLLKDLKLKTYKKAQSNTKYLFKYVKHLLRHVKSLLKRAQRPLRLNVGLHSRSLKVLNSRLRLKQRVLRLGNGTDI